MKDMKKVRLVKSRTNKLLTGVCGGIGELIGIDPTIIRLIWAALSLAGGSGVILYIIAAVIIPEDMLLVATWNITARLASRKMNTGQRRQPSRKVLCSLR